MATVAESLFGVSPESLMATREQRLQEQAMQFGRLSPIEAARAGFYEAGSRLGGVVGGLLGAEDPELAKAAALQSILKRADTTTPEGLTALAKTLGSQGFGAQAIQVMDQARQAQQQAATTRKAELSLQQEEALRKELTNLGPNASESDILKVVIKYGPADKVLTALQTSADKQANREQQAALQKERLEAQAQRDRERAQDRKDLAVLVSSLKTGASQGKPLSAADIKEINKIKSNVDTANTTIEQADTFINLIDEGKMQFGAGENLLGVIRRGVGKANESDLNKVEFEQFVTASVNSILNLAKGPQTDQDAKRAEKQIIDALNKNDSKAVKRGLESLKKVWEGAKATDMSALELYSSERGGKQLTPTTEGKVPTVPKATKRFNPATGKIESL